MRTLADITAHSNNANSIPKPRTRSATKTSPHANALSPTIVTLNRMTKLPPTNRVSTPSRMSTGSDKGASWMASAVKRVGISRVGDGTPRSRKSPKKTGSLPAPKRQPSSSVPSPDLKKFLSSVEKPLPHPPVAQVITKSSPEARTLIDASEMPLRRSPPGDPNQREDWPVLFPAKLTTPSSLQQSTQSDHFTAQQNMHVSDEDPVLRITDASEPPASFKPIEKVDLTRSLNRKPVVTAAESRYLDYSEASTNSATSVVKVPERNTLHKSTKRTTSGRLSATDSPIKKPARGSRDFTHPRQTKTSILRARQSSIPMPRRNENTTTSIEGTVPPDHSKLSEKTKAHSRRAFDIFEERRTGAEDGERVMKQMTESTPSHQYTTKRLSMTSPDHGPILRIHRSAEQVIMGKEPDKENNPKLVTKSGKDLRREVTSKELHKATMTTVPSGDNESQPARPHSSQSLSQCAPLLHNLKESEDRNKKVRIVEVEYALSTNHLYASPTSLKPLASRTNTKSTESDDPFFDARSTPEQTNGVASNDPGDFPPRSSSRVVVPDYTSSPTSPSDAKRRSSDEFVIRQNKLGESQGMGSSQIIHAGGQLKRESTAGFSSNSQGSLSKVVLSNFRGLFHKRSGDHPGKIGKPKVTVTRSGSPFPPISEVHPIHRPTLASTSLRRHPAGHLNTEVPAPVTPTFKSPGPSEVAAMTTLAMHLLDLARVEASSPKKEKYLEMGRVMVDAVTQAREAEKAMVEAKHAARKAEVAYLRCAKSVGDIAKNVQDWRDDIEK